MSTGAKVALLSSVVFTTTIISAVHYNQHTERKVSDQIRDERESVGSRVIFYVEAVTVMLLFTINKLFLTILVLLILSISC